MKARPLGKESNLIQNGHTHFLPHLSIDCVIFGFHNNQLKVLLLQWKDTGKWSLPGGFIFRDEHIDEAAMRILKNRTGIDNIFLQQFRVFGDPKRTRGKHGSKQINESTKNWLKERFVTIGYWSIVDFEKVEPTPDEFSIQCQWWDIANVCPLMLDHNQILDEALSSLRRNLHEFPIGKNLLPGTFTMPELQRLYETILGKKLDRRNFQKKMLALDILNKTKHRKTGGAHKAPFLYKFEAKKYKRALQEGIMFGL